MMKDNLVGLDLAELEVKLAGYEHKFQTHEELASKMFNVPLSEVTSRMREVAKAYNFRILYSCYTRSLL